MGNEEEEKIKKFNKCIFCTCIYNIVKRKTTKTQRFTQIMKKYFIIILENKL